MQAIRLRCSRRSSSPSIRSFGSRPLGGCELWRLRLAMPGSERSSSRLSKVLNPKRTPPSLPRQCHRHPASPSGRQLRRSQRQRARINHRSQSSCYFAGVSEFMEQDDEVLHRLAIELGQMVDVVGVQLPPIDGLARASSRLWRPES
jgi:hypothetical protein